MRLAGHNVPMAKQRHFIREWRKHRGLNQEQLAERLGISRPQVSKIEKSTREVDLATLEALAGILRCEVADLIVRDPSDPEGLWSVWDQLEPTERRQAVDLIRVIKGGKTGTDGR